MMLFNPSESYISQKKALKEEKKIHYFYLTIYTALCYSQVISCEHF